MQNNIVPFTETVAALTRGQGRKILVATVPADGHFNPLTSIAKHLMSIGYDVRWYSSVSYEKKLQRLGIPYFLFNKALEVTGDTLDQLFPARKQIHSTIKKLNFDIIHFFIERGPEYYADLLDIRQDFDFDLVITDCMFTGIPFITDKMMVPVISVGVLPLTETSIDLAPSGLGMTPSYSIGGRAKQQFLRLVADNVLFRKANLVMRKILDSHGIEHKNINLFDILVRKSTLFLQSGTPGFEYHRSDLGRNVRFIGSVLPYEDDSVNNQWFDRRLNQYPQIVLVTQGTVEKDIEKLLVPAIEAYQDTDTLLIVTTGGSQTQELRNRYPYKNIIIEDFIPFNDVMPYADVFISNGGYGGIMLGIENRLPLIVAGVHEGKNEINARIGYFNLGINLKTEFPGPADIRMAVSEIMDNPVYKTNVDRLANEFNSHNANELTAGFVDQLLEEVQEAITGEKAA